MNPKHLINVSLSIFFFFFFTNLFAQANQWIWQSTGSEVNGSANEYSATPNVPSKTNLPATRENASTSVDSAGNLWMYGGGQVSPWSNKLWKYATGTKEWTWVVGLSPDTAPSARIGAASWIDKNGNFWLFGGLGDYSLYSPNDFWKFDLSANKWIRITEGSVPSTGNYGILGVPSPDNRPGTRYASASWKDNDGNLWLFGGYGFGIGASSRDIGTLNDLWKYNIATNEWTWVGGSMYTNSEGAGGSYGTKGVSSPSNYPGARTYSTVQADGKGSVWLYGNSNTLNDLWKYNIADNEWTWMAGDTVSNVNGNNGVYGEKNVAANNNTPGYRFGMCSFIDSTGNFWMFGGRTTRYSNTNPYIGFFNDLWRFDTRNNEWTWIDGDSTTDAVRAYAAENNSDPGGREGMAAWTDDKNRFWMFGGFTSSADGSFAFMNDLWVYTPSLVLPVTLVSFTGKIINQSAVLNWTVAQSVNSKGFEIQKSRNGSTFSDIGFVANTNSSTYTFTDANLSAGISLYRLKQIDINGNFTYSPVVNLDYASFKWNIVNSSSNVNFIQLQLDKSSPVSIQVVASNGTVIQTINKGYLEAGSYSISLDIHQASPGLYIIRLAADGKSDSKKIIKSR